MSDANAFLMSNFKNWILDAIAKEAAESCHIKVNLVYLPVRKYELLTAFLAKIKIKTKSSKLNLFFHHRTFLKYLESNTIQFEDNRIFLTHFDNEADLLQIVRCESLVSKFIVQNSDLKNKLMSHGINSSKLIIYPGAIDRKVFFPSINFSTENQYFLISGDCKPRKNPDFIKWIVQKFPERNFIIHGTGWDVYDNGVFTRLPNVEIRPFKLANQGELLRRATAFISVAKNEGGPISLLEALASGTPVLASNVGFSKDIVKAENGLVVDLIKSTDLWSDYFSQIEKMKLIIFNLDLLYGGLTWEELGKVLYD